MLKRTFTLTSVNTFLHKLCKNWRKEEQFYTVLHPAIMLRESYQTFKRKMNDLGQTRVLRDEKIMQFE